MDPNPPSQNHEWKQGPWNSKGFTLPEILIATAIGAMAAAALLIIVNSSLAMYAQNFSVNQSHHGLRMALDQIKLDVNRASGLPVLTDANGDPVAGNGPAAGIRFVTLEAGPYFLNANANAASNQLNIRNRAPRLAPGLNLIFENPPAIAPISGVNPPGNATDTPVALNVTLPERLGAYTDPPIAGGELIYRRNTAVNVGREVAIRAVPTGDGRAELRYYGDGGDSFRVLCRLVGDGSDLALRPFSRETGAGGQPGLRMTLNVQARRYDNRVNSFFSYMEIDTRIHLR